MIGGISVIGGSNNGGSRSEPADSAKDTDKQNNNATQPDQNNGSDEAKDSTKPAESSGSTAAPPVTSANQTNASEVARGPVGQDVTDAAAAPPPAETIEANLRKAAEAARSDIATSLQIDRIAKSAENAAGSVPSETVVETYEDGETASLPPAKNATVEITG